MEEYNLPNEKGRNKFEIFLGRNVDQMPVLLADNRVPMSIAGIMQRRLDLKEDVSGVREFYLNNYFDTSDLKVQKGDEIKLFLTTYSSGSITPLGREYLGLINPTEKLANRAINLGIENRYENVQGEGVIITKLDKLAEVLDSPLTEEQAKNSLFWRVMLRHPDEVPKHFAVQGLHEEAIRYIFSEGKKRFDYNKLINKLMRVYAGVCEEDSPEMRAWCVVGLGSRSYADGGDDLDDGDGRFVGVSAGGA